MINPNLFYKKIIREQQKDEVMFILTILGMLGCVGFILVKTL